MNWRVKATWVAVMLMALCASGLAEEMLDLSALDDLEELGRTDPMMRELAAIVARHNGLWSPEAERYLLANARSID